MENTSDAKFYVEMVYNVSWSGLVWMIIACVAGDKRRKARQSWGMQEGEECATQGKRTPCAPLALSCAEILHFPFPIEACYTGYDDDNTGGEEE